MSHEVIPDYSEAPYPDKYAKSVKRTQRVVRALWDLEVIGQENVPMEGPGIIAFVHRSYLDPWILGISIPRAVKSMGKIELLNWYYFGLGKKYLTNRGMFFVDRKKMSPSTYRQAVGVLRDDQLLAMAPEGTTKNKRPEIDEIKNGVGRIALGAATRDEQTENKIYPPVIPMAMTTEHLRPGRRLLTVFGEPIVPGVDTDTGGSSKSAGNELNEVVLQGMQAVYEQALTLSQEA
jgi:1-acyl-sn-glycerol-3-phosphate acyltransferase